MGVVSPPPRWTIAHNMGGGNLAVDAKNKTVMVVNTGNKILTFSFPEIFETSSAPGSPGSTR